MKNKKVILTTLALFGISAGIITTMAVSQNQTILNNEFNIGGWKTVFTEEFESPSNWTTCETVDKTITITNEDNIDAAVRIKLEERWLSKDGRELPLVADADQQQMAIINYLENSGWTKSPGGYYYYDADLGKNETTNSLTTGVTLNCDANLDLDDVYAGATYHLKYTAQAIQANKRSGWHYQNDCDSGSLYDTVACQTNGIDTNVDYTKKATVETGNGNGVNTFAPKSDEFYPVYYFRGEVDNNNVIWGDKCWKIIRTTVTGGTKIIYSGEVVEEDGIKKCTAENADAHITYNGSDKFKFNNNATSPADVGYMYGSRLASREIYTASLAITFANSVLYDGTTYTLSSDSITGTWADQRLNAMSRYHYFCTDGSTSCDRTKIGYIHEFKDTQWVEGAGGVPVIHYLNIGGYSDIEAAKEAMFSNNYNSAAKTTIEAWFEAEGLNGLESDLEDTVFCNDRSFSTGSLKSKDNDANNAVHGYNTDMSYFGAEKRIFQKNSDDNY